MPADRHYDTVRIIIPMIGCRQLMRVDVLTRMMVLVGGLYEKMTTSIPHSSGYILLPARVLIVRVPTTKGRIDSIYGVTFLEGTLESVSEVDIDAVDRHDLHSGTQLMGSRYLLIGAQIVLQRDQRIMRYLECHRGTHTERHMKIRHVVVQRRGIGPT